LLYMGVTRSSQYGERELEAMCNVEAEKSSLSSLRYKSLETHYLMQVTRWDVMCRYLHRELIATGGRSLL